MAIERFDGEHRFLSNFYPAEVQYLGVLFPTVEHAYQAAKCANIADFIRIHDAKSPGEAKRLGRTVQIRSSWEREKLGIMRDLLKQKFAPPKMRELLRSTGAEDLIEGNTWGDTYWGVCRGKGTNWLGRLLMETRKEHQ